MLIQLEDGTWIDPAAVTRVHCSAGRHWRKDADTGRMVRTDYDVAPRVVVTIGTGTVGILYPSHGEACMARDALAAKINKVTGG